MAAAGRFGVRQFVMVLLLAVMGVVWLVPAAVPAYAQTTVNADTSDVCGGSGRYFLGMPSWDRGLGDCDNINADELLAGDKVKIIASNVVAIATHIAAFVAVGFVIYGGFAFVLSSGNAEQATNARKTIINAAVGLVIVIMARVLAEVIYKGLTG